MIPHHDGNELLPSMDYRSRSTSRYYMNREEAVLYVSDYLRTYERSKTFQSITIIPAEESGAYYVITVTIEYCPPSKKTRL